MLGILRFKRGRLILVTLAYRWSASIVDSMKTHLLALLLLFAAPLVCQEEIAELALGAKTHAPTPSAQEGYTINYNTVSIIEYIRFAKM
jgi:hypothetical protein